MLKQVILAMTAVAGSAPTMATAQDAALEIRVLGDITPATPSVEIEIWVHFPAEYYAFSGARYSLHASGPGFTPAQCVYPVHHPGAVTEPARIDVVQGQIHFPPILADPANPIWALKARWATDDLTPRVIDLWTETTEFRVYLDRDTSTNVRLEGVIEGSAVVRVLDGGCLADCDGSGALDFFDFLCFQNRFAAADPLADCDGSTALDFFDFLCFQNAFAAGCP